MILAKSKNTLLGLATKFFILAAALSMALGEDVSLAAKIGFSPLASLPASIPGHGGQAFRTMSFGAGNAGEPELSREGSDPS